MKSPDKDRLIPGETAGGEDDSLFEGSNSKRTGSKQDLNLLLLFQSAGLRSFSLRVERRLQCLPILKDILSIVRPESTWNRLAASRRGAAFVFLLYLLPLLLLLAVVE